MEETGQKNNTRGVRYSVVDIEDNVTLKEQLRRAKNILDKMKPVVTVTRKNDDFISKKELKKDIKELYTGDWIVREDGLQVEFSRKLVNNSISKYVQTPSERIAMYAAPYVIKYGEKIYNERSHKGNGHPSITFAAPVVIDGVKGYVGVAVLQTTKNRYRSHRIISTDNSIFEIKMKNVEANGVGNNNHEAIARPTITSTFDNIITYNEEKLNPLDEKKSVDDTIADDREYMAVVERGNMETAQRMVDEAAVIMLPLLFLTKKILVPMKQTKIMKKLKLKRRCLAKRPRWKTHLRI